MMPFYQELPVLGVGLGLRSEIFEETLAATDLIDWVEMTPENYMGRGGQALDRIHQVRQLYPIVTHGVTMSIGSIDPLDEEYLQDLEALFELIDPPWFSDHLCFSGFAGSYSNDLLPLPFTWEAVSHTVSRIRYLQNRFQKPFLIENISYYLHHPQVELSEADFLNEILDQADCSLLLDVNNIYVNGQNHGSDPFAFLEQVPLDRVAQIHIAGHTETTDGIIDTHGESICPDVWGLARWVLERCRPRGILLERDLNMPPFEDLKMELAQLRRLWNDTQSMGLLKTPVGNSLELSR